MEIRQRFLDAEMGEFCEPRINVQSLRAHFNEQMKQAESAARAAKRNALEIEPEELIPAPLRGVIEFRTVNKVGARKGR